MTATPNRARTPRPQCSDCQAWRKAAGCGHLAAGTQCLKLRRLQGTLPGVKAAVDGGEQLRMVDDNNETN